jgi:hypothetical protein
MTLNQIETNSTYDLFESQEPRFIRCNYDTLLEYFSVNKVPTYCVNELFLCGYVRYNMYGRERELSLVSHPPKEPLGGAV